VFSLYERKWNRDDNCVSFTREKRNPNDNCIPCTREREILMIIVSLYERERGTIMITVFPVREKEEPG
jgi:hypothetical protein